MSRRSLRPHLNQIRSWVRQGRTDAWIAHQLEVTVQQIQAFKREQDLEAGEDSNGTAEVDLRAEDDEAIAAELEEDARRRAEEDARKAEEDARKAEEEAARKAAAAEEGSTDEDAEAKPRRARAPRARSRSRKKAGPLEGTFDHGEEGYGLWLDPAVEDDPVYAEHWAGHRPVIVTIEEDQIVIRRAGEQPAGD
jgi:hypothetical protein